MSAGLQLQIVYSWRRTLVGYRLLGPHDRVTVGDVKHVSFNAPRGPGYPRRLLLLAPVKGKAGAFRLRLGPGMTGQVHLRATGIQDVQAILSQPAPPRRFGKDKGFRDVEIHPGDAGVVYLDTANQLKLQWSYVDTPEIVGKENLRNREPLLVRTTVGSAIGLLFALAVILIAAPRELPDDIEITQERFTKYVAPTITSPKFKEDDKAKEEGARKKKEREAAMSKKMKGDDGKLGRKDAVAKDTVIPKGREDILRDKVQKTGLLAALGTAKASGSGLGRLFTNNDSDIDQAVNGLAGAQLAVGKGAGGVGTAGTGLGGGGTGFGRIQGSGDVDVGAGRGRGRKGPGLGNGKEREVSVGMTTGKADADGGLTAEQVARVVNAHKAALQYCYQKELQRKPDLSGKVQLYWLIKPNGSIERVKTESSSLDNRDVEGCMERQVKNWQFPKSTADTAVHYPFFFKGGT